MIHTQRFAAVSLLSLLSACGASVADDDSNGASAGGAGPSAGGTTGAGGAAATGGSNPGGAPSAGGGAPSTGGASLATGGTGGSAAPVDCSGITRAGYELCASSETTCEAVFTDGAGCTAVCAAAGLACDSGAENIDGQCAADDTLPAVACDSGHQSDYCRCSGSTGAGSGGGSGGDGSGGSATGGSGGGATVLGDLSITDPVPGFASVAGGTTGGGTDLGAAIVVRTMSELQSAANGATPTIILVEPGSYNGTLRPGPNKTIIGLRPGVTLTGNISISGSSVSNVIIRNIAVRGNRCNSYDECRAGADAVYVGNGAHHVWLDHLDIADGQDGNCDVTQGGDYVTVSWSHFHYTYAKEHRFSNLIAGSDDEPASVGKLRITYMNSHWGNRVDSRQPRGRFGNVHMLNNYHKTGGSQIHGVGKDMALIAENSVYEENRTIWTDMGSPRGWRGTGNQGTASNLNDSRGTVFTIPYSYTPLPTSQVKAAVTSPECGAGNTCTFSY